MATQITEIQFNALGFSLVKREGVQDIYVYNQYQLIYDNVTYRTEVNYTAGQTIVRCVFASVVENVSDLQGHLEENFIIDGGIVIADTVPIRPGYSLTVTNSDSTFSRNLSTDYTLLDITHTDSDLSSTILPAQTAMVCTPDSTDINLRFHFDIANSITDTATIDAFAAGVYTSIADDGSSGTITVSINGGGFVAFSTLNPLTLVNTDTIAFTRTVTTAAGYSQITGTY